MDHHSGFALAISSARYALNNINIINYLQILAIILTLMCEVGTLHSPILQMRKLRLTQLSTHTLFTSPGHFRIERYRQG